MKEDSSFSEEKEAKRLLNFEALLGFDRFARATSQFRMAPAALLSRIAAAIVTASIPTAWLFVMPGWPLNHEMLRVFRRISIFAGQWRLGHAIPVWSTTAFDGAGSPSPILYHKIFTCLSTLLAMLTGSPKIAVCVSIVLVLAALFLGIAKSCRILLERDALMIEVTAGMLAVFAIYTTTDWLIRGAMGEATAMAGTAWLFAWCLVLIQRGCFSLWIGPLMAAMYFAHPAIAFMCAIPLAIVSAIAVLRWRGRAFTWIWPALASMGSCLLLIGPWLIASLPYTRYASLTLLRERLDSPRYTHVPFSHLFYEPAWHFRDCTLGVTVQIDWLLLVFGALSVPVCIIHKPYRAAGAFLGAVLITMLLLQTSWALPVYDWVPGLAWLQFTYRLLVFVTIALALCGALVLDRIRVKGGIWLTGGLCAACAVVMSLGKPWLGAAPTAFYSAHDVAAPMTREVFAPEPWEYGAAPLLANRYSYTHRSAASGCFATPLDDLTRERKTARFTVGCTIDGNARLPIALAPGMRFTLNGRLAAPRRVCPDALARLPIPNGVVIPAVVVVTYPTFRSAVASAVLGGDPALSCP